MVLIPFLAVASIIPQSGYSGRPGDGTCRDCHPAQAIEPQDSSFILGLPDTLLPGTIYQCTLVFHHRGLSLWSFELSTVDSLSRQAGGCIITDPRHTTLDTLLGVIYLKNTLRGVFLGQPDSARWAFAYASPDCNIGPVSFYWTGYLSRRTSRRNYHIVENSITLPQRLDPEE